MFTGRLDGLSKVLVDKNDITVLCPEVIEFYKNNKEVSVNPRTEKSEVFAMGLTTLSLATGENFEIFYDQDNKNVKFGLLYDWMNKIYLKSYPKSLCDILLKMLDEIPAARPSFDELKEKLNEVQIEEEKLNFTYNRKLSDKYGEDEPVHKE